MLQKRRMLASNRFVSGFHIACIYPTRSRLVRRLISRAPNISTLATVFPAIIVDVALVAIHERTISHLDRTKILLLLWRKFLVHSSCDCPMDNVQRSMFILPNAKTCNVEKPQKPLRCLVRLRRFSDIEENPKFQHLHDFHKIHQGIHKIPLQHRKSCKCFRSHHTHSSKCHSVDSHQICLVCLDWPGLRWEQPGRQEEWKHTSW